MDCSRDAGVTCVEWLIRRRQHINWHEWDVVKSSATYIRELPVRWRWTVEDAIIQTTIIIWMMLYWTDSSELRDHGKEPQCPVDGAEVSAVCCLLEGGSGFSLSLAVTACAQWTNQRMILRTVRRYNLVSRSPHILAPCLVLIRFFM